jgi:hypothetical protein
MIEKRVIDKMLEILGENGENWTQGREARTTNGEMTTWNDPSAVCYCLFGAERKALHELKGEGICHDDFYRTFLYLMRGYTWNAMISVPQWNDAGDRTWEHIKTLLLWMRDFKFNDLKG